MKTKKQVNYESLLFNLEKAIAAKEHIKDLDYVLNKAKEVRKGIKKLSPEDREVLEYIMIILRKEKFRQWIYSSY